jgi:hypothetical protein
MATANGVYRQALAAALADGRSKAEFLASNVSAALGPVQSLAEGGGYITCTASDGSYEEYEGQQPDFPSSQVGVGVLGAASPALGRPVVGHRLARSRHRSTAHKATAPGCTLRASVSVSYQIG